MYKCAFAPAAAFSGLVRPIMGVGMPCVDCDPCQDCTISFLHHFVEAFASIGLALLQFCTSLAGVVLAVVILIGAGLALLRC